MPSDPSPPGAPPAWASLHGQLLTCERCVLSGHLPFALPMFQGRPDQRIMLVGQAPGERELAPRKPFAGRSGAELSRWAVRAGFRDDDHFRGLTYITSVTKCFPGKARTGPGDRRPSSVEVAQCRPWLEGQLELVQPRLLILVGGLAHDAFAVTAGRPLDSLVGTVLDADGADHADTMVAGGPLPAGTRLPLHLPLPHPSGASRWLNSPAHRQQLDRALAVLAAAWPALGGDAYL
ncbi:MAG: uracil-DNA glycosylase family protein [Candidatus Dormibacteria bacterium]